MWNPHYLSHSSPPRLFFVKPSLPQLGWNEEWIDAASEERFHQCICTSIHILYEHLLAVSIVKINWEIKKKQDVKITIYKIY